MSVMTWTYLIVGLSFALYIGIAIWSKVGTTKEYYVAGSGVHPVMNGMATAADWMSAASFISMAGLISFMGRDGGVYLMGWTGGYVLLAMLLAPYLRKFGKYTVPDFIGDRYYSDTARLVAVICAVFVSFTYVAGQMRGVGIVFSRFLEVPINTGVMIGMAIVFFYAVLGGMKGITYTQVAQYCVLIFAYLVPAIFISMLLTGHVIPQFGFGAELQDGGHLLDKLNGLSTELGFAPYTSGAKSTIDVFCITFALMVGTAGLPHVIVRFFTVPKVSDARMFYTKGDANEMTIDRDIMVLANPEIANLPNWVIALVAAGGLAAALSTAAGLLLVISSSISHDLLKKMIMKDITEKQELLYARIAAFFAVVVAGLLGIFPPAFVAQVVAFAFGLAAASFFPAIILGIFDKRANMQGAISGMVVGIVFTAGYIINFKFINPGNNNPDHWLWGISPEGIGTIGMLLNIAVTYAISHTTAPPPAHIQDLVDHIRVPRGAGAATHH
jgi:cation/acetate symporter